jgi:uncharacterized protein YaaQ
MQKLILTLVFALLTTNVYGIDVFITHNVVGRDSPVIHAKTNLPDHTKLFIAIFNDKLDYNQELQTIVVDGQFETGPLRHNGEEMSAGTYSIVIAVELAQFQPESVKSIIGNHGENLQGALVRKGMLGNQVYYASEFALKN